MVEAKASTELTDYWVRDLLDRDAVYEMLASGDSDDLGNILANAGLDDEGVNQDALERHLRRLNREMSEAVGIIQDFLPRAESHLEWPEFRRQHGLRPDHAEVWQWVYERLVRQRTEESRASRRARDSEGLGPFASQWKMPGLDGFTMPMLSNFDGTRAAAYDVALQDRLVRNADLAFAQVEGLKHEVELAESQYADSQSPAGIGLAISFLVYISAVTVFVSLVPLTLGVVHLPIWSRGMPAVLFASGILMLLRYLLVYGRFLQSANDERALPRSLVGLLRHRRSKPLRH